MSGVSGGILLLAYAIGMAASVGNSVSVASARNSRRRASEVANQYEAQRRSERGYIRSNNNSIYTSSEQSQRQQAEAYRQQLAQQRQAQERQAQQRQEQERRAQTNRVSNSIGNFRGVVAGNMNEQVRLNRQTSEMMMNELDRSRQNMLDSMNFEDPKQYQQYMEQIEQNRKELSKALSKMQGDFVENYHTSINASMQNITADINKQYAEYADELQKLQSDDKQKQEMASSLANDYIEEAKTLMLALDEDYQGRKYAKNQMLELQRAINDAVAQYNIGNYEAAIAVAKDSAIAIIEEIYKADCKHQEWENYYKLALVLSTEISEMIEGQRSITPEVKAEIEAKTGRQLEEDIVGVDISEYTGIREDGQNQFEYLLGQVNSIKQLLESEDGKELSTDQLKEYIDTMNNKIYPAASMIFFRGIMNMNNAFSRQNISEEIIDFFEEHNFEFKGFSYDDEKHDGALHIGLENESTGEEIIVTLAPELMEGGDVQTRVEIDQLKGDETNEARKEFFRQSVTDCVVGSTPGAQIKLECKHETKNKLSDKTQLRDKLR